MTNKEIVEEFLDILLEESMKKCPDFASEVFQIVNFVELPIIADEDYELMIITELTDADYKSTKVKITKTNCITDENEVAKAFPDIVRELDRYKRLAKT